MEDKEKEIPKSEGSALYKAFFKTRSWIATSLGIILMVVGIIAIMIVSSVEGTKEIEASNYANSAILSKWRKENDAGEGDFPEERVDTFAYDGEEYYFVAERNEAGEVVDWYFAHDGGFQYVFSDYKTYVLTSLTIIISVYVGLVNYNSSVRSAMQTQPFQSSLLHYKKSKDKVRPYTQYLPYYCRYKNSQAYETAKQDIIEDANLNYEDYVAGRIDFDSLAKWQQDKLRAIEKIKIKKIYSPDLLQESGTMGQTIALLPMSQEEHRKRYLKWGTFQKVAMSVLSGAVMAFSIAIGNWTAGLAYALTIFISYVSAVIVGSDFTTSTLRNRFIGKAAYLDEFFNIKEKFEKEHEELKAKNQEEPQEEAKKDTPKIAIENPLQTRVIDLGKSKIFV